MLRGLTLLALVACAQGSADPVNGEAQDCCPKARPFCCGSTCITLEQSEVVRCVAPTCCDAGGEQPGGGGEEPCACTRELRPVCGADGVTYNNPCLAEKCAGTTIDSEGPCASDGGSGGGGGDGEAEPSPGRSAEQPVCCGASCITLEAAARTSCPVSSDCTGGAAGGGATAGGGGGGAEPVDGCVCIALYDPVCGEDGVTYGNSCNAGCAGTPIACEGECPCAGGGGDTTEEPVSPPTPTPDGGSGGGGGGGGRPRRPSPGCTRQTPVCCGSGCITREEATRALCPAESDCTAPGNGGGNGGGGGGGGEEPCVCIALYAPVCGEDGQTYSNEGCAACDNTAIACDGECPCGDGGPGGPDRPDPVPEVGCTEPEPICCGSTCITREDAARTLCPVDSDCSGGGSGGGEGCICGQIFAPVCGENGQTYPNSCVAGCDDAPVACDGECPCGDGGPGPTDPDQPDPVPEVGCTEAEPICCGSTCLTREDAARTRCPGDSDCSGGGEGCVCAEIFAPVCGKNGQTYPNDCTAGCEDEPIACDGECPCGGGGGEGPTDPNGAGGEVCNCDGECNCTGIFAPVCGGDGTSYGNSCEAQCAGAEVVGFGPCPDDEFEDCCPDGYKCCGSCIDENNPTLVACDPRECGPEECDAELPPLPPTKPQPSPGCGGPTPVCCGGRCITLEEAARSSCPADSSCETPGTPPTGPDGAGEGGCCPKGFECCGRTCVPTWLHGRFGGGWCGEARCCAAGGGRRGGAYTGFGYAGRLRRSGGQTRPKHG